MERPLGVRPQLCALCVEEVSLALARGCTFDLGHLLPDGAHDAAEHLVSKCAQLRILVIPELFESIPQRLCVLKQQRARQPAALAAAVGHRLLGERCSRLRRKEVEAAPEHLQRRLGRAEAAELFLGLLVLADDGAVLPEGEQPHCMLEGDAQLVGPQGGLVGEDAVECVERACELRLPDASTRVQGFHDETVQRVANGARFAALLVHIVVRHLHRVRDGEGPERAQAAAAHRLGRAHLGLAVSRKVLPEDARRVRVPDRIRIGWEEHREQLRQVGHVLAQLDGGDESADGLNAHLGVVHAFEDLQARVHHLADVLTQDAEPLSGAHFEDEVIDEAEHLDAQVLKQLLVGIVLLDGNGAQQQLGQPARAVEQLRDRARELIIERILARVLDGDARVLGGDEDRRCAALGQAEESLQLLEMASDIHG